MANDKKTRNEFIVDALLSGEPRRVAEITRMISDAMGEEIRGQDVSSLVAKLANIDKCNLGYFMKKEKTGSGFKFSLVNEIRELATDEIYALTRKFGRYSFTLEEAIRKVPKLKKYVTAAKRQAMPGRGPGRPRKDSGRESAVNAGLNGLLAALVQELARQSGLKVNVNLIVHLEGFGG